MRTLHFLDADVAALAKLAEVCAALIAAVDRVRTVIRTRFRADEFNVGLNDGAAAGQTVFHLDTSKNRPIWPERWITLAWLNLRFSMKVSDPRIFDIHERLKDLSANGDDLERIKSPLDFEVFRPDLERAVPRSRGAKGGSPAFDHMRKFEVLIL